MHSYHHGVLPLADHFPYATHLAIDSPLHLWASADLAEYVYTGGYNDDSEEKEALIEYCFENCGCDYEIGQFFDHITDQRNIVLLGRSEAILQIQGFAGQAMGLKGVDVWYAERFLWLGEAFKLCGERTWALIKLDRLPFDEPANVKIYL